MRDDTNAWLTPMTDAATTIDTAELMMQATMPAAEADDPTTDWMVSHMPDDPRVRLGAIDWVRFGYLLRHQLGWDDTYPDHPAERAN